MCGLQGWGSHRCRAGGSALATDCCARMYHQTVIQPTAPTPQTRAHRTGAITHAHPNVHVHRTGAYRLLRRVCPLVGPTFLSDQVHPLFQAGIASMHSLRLAAGVASTPPPTQPLMHYLFYLLHPSQLLSLSPIAIINYVDHVPRTSPHRVKAKTPFLPAPSLLPLPCYPFPAAPSRNPFLATPSLQPLPCNPFPAAPSLQPLPCNPFTATPRSARADTHCDLYVLTRADFDLVLRDFPEPAQGIIAAAEKLLHPQLAKLIKKRVQVQGRSCRVQGAGARRSAPATRRI